MADAMSPARGLRAGDMAVHRLQEIWLDGRDSQRRGRGYSSALMETARSAVGWRAFARAKMRDCRDVLVSDDQRLAEYVRSDLNELELHEIASLVGSE